MPEPAARRRALAVGATLILLPPAQYLAYGPHVPEGTFFLLSRLADSVAASDPSNLIYAQARPPVYFLLGFVFQYPLAFLLAGFIAHTLFAFALYRLTTAGARDLAQSNLPLPIHALALALVVLAYPLARQIGLADYTTSFVPHDAFNVFSFRTIFWTTCALAYSAYMAGQLRAMLWIAAAGSLVHPSAGLIGFGFATLGSAMSIVRNRDTALALHWMGAALLCGLPTVLNGLLVGTPDPGALVSNGEWYSAMLKNEADDFSFLYQLRYNPKHVGAMFALTGGVVGAYASWTSSAAWRDRNVIAVLAVPAVFLLGVLVEFLFAVLWPTPLIRFIVGLTPGYRLLSFAFFPLMVLIARLGLHWSGAIRRYPMAARWARVVSPAVIALACIVPVAHGFSSQVGQRSVRYAVWAFGAGKADGIDDYYLGAERAGLHAESLELPRLYSLTRPALVYPGERNIARIHAADRHQVSYPPDLSLQAITTDGFAGLARFIRSDIPAGEGIIVPPYLRGFRDALPDHRVFFQEHHDGNLMLGSPAFFAFWQPRMRALGFGYEDMPSDMSRLPYTIMRNAYRVIDERRASDLHGEFPDYRYFVAEAGQRLTVTTVFENESFVVYDLGSLRALASDRSK